MDKFSLVNIPCTYQPVACNLLPTEQVAACQAGQKIWTDVFGCPKTNTSTASTQNKTFYQQEIGGRICSKDNYCEYSARTSDNAERGCTKRSDMLWYPSPQLDVGSPHRDSVPYCACNWKQLEARANGTNVTTGVPDGFIKDGTSTFYVQVMIGGRDTASNLDDPGCACAGPQDHSAACMCYLGNNKVPYIYNYSAVPYYTALVSVTNGLLIYKNTYVRFNFESNGIGCSACGEDNCWGAPSGLVCKDPDACTANELEGWDWKYSDRFLGIQTRLMCAVPLRPPLGLPDFKDPAKYAGPKCGYPAGPTSLDLCSLKIYVAWVGTDGYGHACQSNNEMFSKFTQMGVSSLAQGVGQGLSGLAADFSSGFTSRSPVAGA